MLYYRRKILLALLEVFNGRLTTIQMQKLLFLLTRLQEEKSYFFVPYYYGCFSFQANQDMATLGTYGYVRIENKNYILCDYTSHYLCQLDLFDQQHVRDIHSKYSGMSQDELITYTYVHYPFYAINSTIAKEMLTSEQYAKVMAQKRHINEKQLFTIGYEGVSLEQYINKLILCDVHVLCDVRKNAYSQKYGFSKSQLEKACQGAHIQYIHIPTLGIESEKRTCLQKQQDYDSLFAEYERTTLKDNAQSLLYVYNLIQSENRVALTCFEKDPKQCHRTRVANALMKMSKGEYSLNQIVF